MDGPFLKIALSVFALGIVGILVGTVLMFMVSLTVLSYRAYRIAKGTWAMSVVDQVRLERWAEHLTTARWIGHLGAVVGATLLGYYQQWPYVAALVVAWGFLAVVLRMTVGILLQWAGTPLPSTWWSRLRRRHAHS